MMKTSFDLNSILYRILRDAQLKITGDIYTDTRPDGSDLEDITINTIDVSQEYEPQLAVSNINIHVSDLDVKIAGRPQKKADSARLNSLTKEVLTIVRNAKITGLKFVAEGQNVLKDKDAVAQHYSNIRISWSIHE